MYTTCVHNVLVVYNKMCDYNTVLQCFDIKRKKLFCEPFARPANGINPQRYLFGRRSLGAGTKVGR